MIGPISPGWECPTPLEIAYFYSVKVVPARKNVAGGFYYLGAYTGDRKLIVSFPNKTDFKEDFFWTTALSPINTTAFRIYHMRPVPTPKIVKRQKTLLSLPYGLRAADFLLNKQNLKNVGLLASYEYTCDSKLPKYTSWKNVPVLEEEESNDFVARAHYLERVPPREPKRTKTKANKKKFSIQLTVEAAKSPKARNKVSAAGIEVSAAGNEVPATGIVEEQPIGSVYQVKFSGSRSEWVEMLEIELRKVMEHRDVVAKKWSDSEVEVSRAREEAKKQHQADQQKIKELEDSLKSLQVDHDKKLKELEAKTKERVNNIGRRTIYQI
uniref:Uncharacterized protein n=1 Tax=Cannabis sativa TaxID=3483 RepID=A0A803Q638_CANSA